MPLALYQPDIPQNVGSILRLGACFAVPLHVIEPCGFAFDDKRIKRSGMDYIEHAEYQRHVSWDAFCEWRSVQNPQPRLLVLSSKAEQSPYEFSFKPDDILLLGRESSGLPPEVHGLANARLRIPISKDVRSLNVAMAAAITLAEALRQTGNFPKQVL